MDKAAVAIPAAAPSLEVFKSATSVHAEPFHCSVVAPVTFICEELFAPAAPQKTGDRAVFISVPSAQLVPFQLST